MILDKYTLLEVRAELSCRILLLPEQAWEEAQDQCIHAVEALLVQVLPLVPQPSTLEAEQRAQHYWQQEFYRVEKMVLAEQDRVEELERQLAAAKEAIEDAPHAEYCGVPSSSGAEVYECRCWKAEALSKLGVDREGKL